VNWNSTWSWGGAESADPAVLQLVHPSEAKANSARSGMVVFIGAGSFLGIRTAPLYRIWLIIQSPAEIQRNPETAGRMSLAEPRRARRNSREPHYLTVLGAAGLLREQSWAVFMSS
jgi:hypothetical protein